MIIQVRGTSGSGKTTVMRRVMEATGKWTACYHTTETRRKPLYYFSERNRQVIVMGHYESACGGCDTIGSAAEVYRHVMDLIVADADRIILCEGLLLSEDTKWSSQMPDLRVCFLTTSLERSLAQVESRRREAGNDKPLNPENTTRRVAVIERARVKLVESGVLCRRASPEQAPGMILDWIGVGHANRMGALPK